LDDVRTTDSHVSWHAIRKMDDEQHALRFANPVHKFGRAPSP